MVSVYGLTVLTKWPESSYTEKRKHSKDTQYTVSFSSFILKIYNLTYNRQSLT